MTSLIVDASVAIKWFVAEEDSELAQRVLVAPVELWAPDLLRLEIANGMWKNWRKQLASTQQVRGAIAALDRTIGAWHDSASLLDAAMNLALALNHGIYDCTYLALAQASAVPVITADKRLVAIAPKGLAIALADWRR